MLQLTKCNKMLLGVAGGLAILIAAPVMASEPPVTETAAGFGDVAARPVSDADVGVAGEGRGKVVVALAKFNVKIWAKNGWDYGRYESIKRHGPAGDPGPFPGTLKALGLRR